MSLTLLATILLTVGWMTVSVAGIILLFLGIRGHRVDYLPRCRACRYVIDGGFDHSMCSECGADLSETGTIRIGVRRVNETQFIFSIIFLMISAGPVVWLIRSTNAPAGVPAAAAIVAKPITTGNARPLSNAATTDAKRSSEWKHTRSNTSTFDEYDTVQTAYASLLERSATQSQLVTTSTAQRAAIYESNSEPSDIASGADSAVLLNGLYGLGNAQLVAPNTGVGLVSIMGPSTGDVYSVEVASLVPELAPLTVNLRGSGHAFVQRHISSAASPWSSSTVGASKPINLKMTSTAVKPPRVGGRRR